MNARQYVESTDLHTQTEDFWLQLTEVNYPTQLTWEQIPLNIMGLPGMSAPLITNKLLLFLNQSKHEISQL